MTDLTDERLPPKHGWRPDGSDPLALKLWEIRHQLYCNVEIVKRGHPDPEPRILPHVIETLTDHVYDRLNELESILTHRTNGGEAVAWRFRQKGMTLWSHMEDRPPLGADGMSAHEWECEPLYASPVAIPQDGTSGVRVKALEWRYYPDAFPPAWDAPTAFGRYSIEEGMIANTEDPTWHSDSYPTWNVDFSGGLLSVWRSLDEAKAAAQTDYETRILAALEPSP